MLLHLHNHSPPSHVLLTMNLLPTKIPKGPVVALALTSSITLYAIFYSHYSQVSEKEVMHAGVARDKERLRLNRKKKKKKEVLMMRD